MQGIAGNNFWMNVGLIQALGNSLLYFIGCALVLQGDLSYGEVVAFCAYGNQLLWPAVRFSQLASQLQQVSIATERLFEIFDEPPEIQDALMRCRFRISLVVWISRMCVFTMSRARKSSRDLHCM